MPRPYEIYLKEQVIVGNKIDLEEDRVIGKDQGRSLADKYNIPYVETSAMTGENVEELFLSLVQQMPRNGIEYKVGTVGINYVNIGILSRECFTSNIAFLCARFMVISFISSSMLFGTCS